MSVPPPPRHAPGGPGFRPRGGRSPPGRFGGRFGGGGQRRGGRSRSPVCDHVQPRPPCSAPPPQSVARARARAWPTHFSMGVLRCVGSVRARAIGVHPVWSPQRGCVSTAHPLLMLLSLPSRPAFLPGSSPGGARGRAAHHAAGGRGHDRGLHGDDLATLAFSALWRRRPARPFAAAWPRQERVKS